MLDRWGKLRSFSTDDGSLEDIDSDATNLLAQQAFSDRLRVIVRLLCEADGPEIAEKVLFPGVVEDWSD
jgi:hypothetical protein